MKLVIVGRTLCTFEVMLQSLLDGWLGSLSGSGSHVRATVGV